MLTMKPNQQKKPSFGMSIQQFYQVCLLCCLLLIIPIMSDASNSFCQYWDWVEQFNNSGGSLRIDDMVEDSTGNLYFAGHFFNDYIVVGSDTFDLAGSSVAGPKDAIVGKIDSNGHLQWAKHFGGGERDRIRGIDIGPEGRFYIAGETESDSIRFGNNFSITHPAPNTTNSIGFCLELLPNGTTVNLKQPATLAGQPYHRMFDIITDVSGNIYVTGDFKDTIQFSGGVTLTQNDTINNRDRSSFLVKYDSTWNSQWAKQSAGQAILGDLVYDNTHDKIILSANVAEATYGKNLVEGLYVARFTKSGLLQWEKGATVSNSFKVGYEDSKLDSSGNIYVCGGAFTDSFRLDNKLFVNHTDSTEDVFIAKYGKNGNVKNLQYFGGIYDDDVYSIALTNNGKGYVAGYNDGHNISTKNNEQFSFSDGLIHDKNFYLLEFSMNDLGIKNGQIFESSGSLGGKITGSNDNGFYIMNGNPVQPSPYDFNFNSYFFGKLQTLPAPSYSIDSTLPACNMNNGSISLSPQNPSMYDLVYSVDSGKTWGTDSSFSNLNTGLYDVVVADTSGGCYVNQGPIALNNPKAPTIGSIQTSKNSQCPPDGKISIFASGGVQPYQYSIDNGQAFKSSYQFDSLSDGTYDIVVKDSQNCKTFTRDTVQRADSLLESINAFHLREHFQDSCALQDSISFYTVSGVSPFEYSIDGGQTFQSKPNQTFYISGTDTTYEIIAEDSIGCRVSDSVTVPPASYANCDSIWPGDANANGVANMYDVLNIGIAFGDSGIARNNPSSNWTPQLAPNWYQQFSSGLNYSHADCDGNGMIDSFDVDVVNQNYGLTHNKKGSDQQNPALPALQFVSNQDSVVAGQQVSIGVYLGSSSQPVSNVYGLAFQLQYDPTIVDTNSVNVLFDSTWISGKSNRISLVKELPNSGRIDIAYSRIDQKNTTGYGKVADISYYVQDNIAGKKNQVQLMPLELLSAKVVANDGSEVDVKTISDSVFVRDKQTSVKGLNPFESDLTVYPTPATNQVQLVLGKEIKNKQAQVQLFNQVGQLVRKRPLEQQQTQLKTAHLERGVYFLRVNTENKVWQRKVVLH